MCLKFAHTSVLGAIVVEEGRGCGGVGGGVWGGD